MQQRLSRSAANGSRNQRLILWFNMPKTNFVSITKLKFREPTGPIVENYLGRLRLGIHFRRESPFAIAEPVSTAGGPNRFPSTPSRTGPFVPLVSAICLLQARLP